MNKNPSCGGSHCSRSNGEVRVLPTGGDSNAILCHSCFVHEMNYRADRNKTLPGWAQFKTPNWGELKPYKGD